MPRFSANLGFLFADAPFLDRFGRASRAGFEVVEYMFPYDYAAAEVARELERHGLRQDLFNLPAGDFAAGERGVAVDPRRRAEFREGVERALEYAARLDCQKLNCLVGRSIDDIAWDDQYACLVENLAWACERLESTGIVLHVELLNSVETPGFFLDSLSAVRRLLGDVPALRFQADVYHLQRTGGAIGPVLRQFADRIGHVQIADAPGRHEPGTGEIDFPLVFSVLDQISYGGYVGLEYEPSTPSTEGSLGWAAGYGLVPRSQGSGGTKHRPMVGFIGLGVMGRPMARNLLSAGFPLVVHSRSPEPVAELVSLGAARAETPTDVARHTDVVITMLPDTTDVETVLLGENGVIESVRENSLVIDMSSIDPLATRRVAEILAERGATLLDAPVSGGEVGATEGTLSIMVGGDADAFERARPMFEVLGKNIVHVGSSGAGQTTKACNQLVVGSTIEAVAEALVLALSARVDPAKVRQALLGGFAGSPILELHGQRMLDHAFEPGFRIQLHAKDARIISDTAEAVGVPLRGFAPVAQALHELVEQGGGDFDHSALITLLQQATGTRLDRAGSADIEGAAAK